MNGFGLLRELCTEADGLVAAYGWKVQAGRQLPLIACFIGGTGTGKSTLFNSLAGAKIGEVGIRRPCTVKAVVLVHEQFAPGIQASPYLNDVPDGSPTIVSHRQSDLLPLILVDTPDFDSVEASNRLIFESIFVICDVVIYVASQEKYADQCGWKMLMQAIGWGKKTICVMNKVTSDAAYNDFRDNVLKLDREISPVRVEKLDHSPEFIPGLRDRPAFAEILQLAADDSLTAQTRASELKALHGRTIRALESLETAAEEHAARIAEVNSRIGRVLGDVSREMESGLDAVVTTDIEVRIRERLKTLLRKYDILYVPRMMVRNTLRKAFHSVFEIVGMGNPFREGEDGDLRVRAEDLQKARSAARLEPLHAAVGKLNLQIAQILSSDSGLEDLRQTAGNDVARWGPSKIDSLHEEAFPGVEHLLEVEFNRFREGLSRSDEMKLYGSYTVWALFLITAEIIVGGGFTLFDAVLNTVIVPFIPKWLLNVKVLDLLREIGERVDKEHRSTLHGILEAQAAQYVTLFSGMVPDRERMDLLRRLRVDLPSPGQ